MEAFNGLALCAGYGGFELALKLLLGERYRTVCYVEKDARAASTLVARMGDKTLDAAPIWDCVETFDGKAWRGAVDIITAGFPCQPWTHAGKRLGTEDERWIWPAIRTAIADVDPGWVILENVTGLLDGGIEHVLRDLANIGFNAEWGVFSAARSGAPHIRKRVVILAYANRKRLTTRWGRFQVLVHGGPFASVEPSQLAAHYPLWPGASGRDWESSPILPLRKSGLHRALDGHSDFVDRYRLLGNGIVPDMVARAIITLAGRLK